MSPLAMILPGLAQGRRPGEPASLCPAVPLQQVMLPLRASLSSATWGHNYCPSVHSARVSRAASHLVKSHRLQHRSYPPPVLQVWKEQERKGDGWGPGSGQPSALSAGDWPLSALRWAARAGTDPPWQLQPEGSVSTYPITASPRGWEPSHLLP